MPKETKYMATQCWTNLKKKVPDTPEQFMACIRNTIPNINDQAVITCQQACEKNNWELQIFNFLWVYLQLEQGHFEYAQLIQQTWPKIKNIIEEKSLEDLFANIKI